METSRESMSFDKTTTRIDMSQKRIAKIDLSSLSECVNLKALILEENQLQELDLGPLVKCEQLEELTLTRNRLKTIDLTPLAQCTKLRVLRLNENELGTIDLEPLSKWHVLEEINLGDNRIQSIDLKPISSCTRLKQLILKNNRLTSISLHSLSRCKNLDTIDLVGNRFRLLDIGAVFELKRNFDGLFVNKATRLVTHPQLRERAQPSLIEMLKWRGQRIEFEEPEEEPVEAEPEPIQEEPHITGVDGPAVVKALRGCEFIGNVMKYKVKVTNSTEFIINDVTVTLVSYPRDSLRLRGDSTKVYSKIGPDEFRSATFEFMPSQDCVKGTVHSNVVYIDSRGGMHSINTEPFTVRAVCDLLTPEMIKPDDFEGRVLSLEHGESTVRVDDWTHEQMLKKTLQVVKLSNFFEVKNTTETIGDHVESLVSGWAKGKYTGKNVAVQIRITGRPGVKGANCNVRVSGEDEAMILPAIDEVAHKLSAWLCPRCYASLPPEYVNDLKTEVIVICPFCNVSIGMS